MTKTIYIRTGEESLWKRAKRIAELKNDNMSSIIMGSLRRYVAKNEEVARRMEALLKRSNKNGT